MSDLEEPGLHVAGRAVADYVLEPDVDQTLVPRPYLHPVRTLAGTVVTDVLPADHEWHLGAGLAIADVSGTNLWGGRSYVHGKGYVWLPDHGRIDHVVWHQHSDSALEHDLVWRDHEGASLLAEHRTITAAPSLTAATWVLTFSTRLTNVRSTPIEIRSPATNGRGDGAGYGGFFWRLPRRQSFYSHVQRSGPCGSMVRPRRRVPRSRRFLRIYPPPRPRPRRRARAHLHHHADRRAVPIASDG